MRDTDDHARRATVLASEPATDVECRPLAPARERRRREERIQRSGEFGATALREEAVNRECTNAVDGRRDDVFGQRRKVRRLTGAMAPLGEEREQDVFAAFGGIGVAVEEA